MCFITILTAVTCFYIEARQTEQLNRDLAIVEIIIFNIFVLKLSVNVEVSVAFCKYIFNKFPDVSAEQLFEHSIRTELIRKGQSA